MKKLIYILPFLLLSCDQVHNHYYNESDSTKVNIKDSVIIAYDTVQVQLTDEVMRNVDSIWNAFETEKNRFVDSVNSYMSWRSAEIKRLNKADSLVRALFDYDNEIIERHYVDIEFKESLYNKSFKNELIRKGGILIDTANEIKWCVIVAAWDSTDRPMMSTRHELE